MQINSTVKPETLTSQAPVLNAGLNTGLGAGASTGGNTGAGVSAFLGANFLSRLQARLPNFDGEKIIQASLMLGVVLVLIVAVLLPLSQIIVKSLTSSNGDWVGLANYQNYFSSPALRNSFKNSLFISTLTMLLVVPAAFAYAYGLTRTLMRGRGLMLALSLLPLFAPTLLNGLALVYLFGRQGLVTKGLFGLLPGLDVGLYGPVGVVLAEAVYTFPQAVIILATSLRLSDGNLADAARSMGISPLRFFFSVTLPSVKYGLASAAVLCFILAFTDFGAPKIVGASYSLLATDIYKQVIGQQNFAMGSVVSVVLLLPVIIAFFVDHIARKGQSVQLGSRSKPFVPKGDKLRDSLFGAYCWSLAIAILIFFLVAVMASLVVVWPYDLSLGLKHYSFKGVAGGGYGALWGSLKMSIFSAIFGTIFCFGSAYLVEKAAGLVRLRRFVSLLSLLPLALPGMVIGLAYIFFFNAPSFNLGPLTLPNPLNFLYGTMGILVLCNMIHFFTVGFFTATSALKQLDKEFETVSHSLGVPFWVTFRRVTVRVCSPAILEIFFFFFVNSMTTVSAVIFLYNVDLPLASVAIANMDDAGDLAPACAMGVLIMLVNLTMRIIKSVLGHFLSKQHGAWLARARTA